MILGCKQECRTYGLSYNGKHILETAYPLNWFNTQFYIKWTKGIISLSSFHFIKYLPPLTSEVVNRPPGK